VNTTAEGKGETPSSMGLLHVVSARANVMESSYLPFTEYFSIFLSNLFIILVYENIGQFLIGVLINIKGR
jgi:hypothetical protein